MNKEELNGILKYKYNRIKDSGILDFGIEIKFNEKEEKKEDKKEEKKEEQKEEENKKEEKDNKDYTKWEIILTAPEDSEYNGSKYTIIADFPLDYPMENPKFTFETEIYHCNVDENNNLKVSWLMKGMKIEYILPRLLTLFYLQDPNVDENYEKCKIYKNNYEKFKENIKKPIKEQ